MIRVPRWFHNWNNKHYKPAIEEALGVHGRIDALTKALESHMLQLHGIEHELTEWKTWCEEVLERRVAALEAMASYWDLDKDEDAVEPLPWQELD